MNALRIPGSDLRSQKFFAAAASVLRDAADYYPCSETSNQKEKHCQTHQERLCSEER